MKKISLLLMVLFMAFMSQAQSHKIVFQVTSADTLVHKAVLKQLEHIFILAPDAKVEVVCHGPGLSMLVKEKSIVQPKVHEMSEKGVAFVACEFSMKERNVTKDQILTDAGTVKGGIIEIATKQEQGWAYIKAGF
ncbi:DsrE family protein [Flavihumibacter fluvii]|uniref:DsrE family protein n=1 Tax=Flavihumibacter fluvii TaxID=2838157 RepID=UPI001BDF5DF3|nr:DsrE family protein [Flavihumibacter fluvii]ULQ53151.1 DsrE family protein [Flavihumibacter fluvii]